MLDLSNFFLGVELRRHWEGAVDTEIFLVFDLKMVNFGVF